MMTYQDFGGPGATVSDKIRQLDRTGMPRAEIARVLGKRYQHVRNVLEADKAKIAQPVRDAPSMAKAAQTEPRTQRIGAVVRMRLADDGTVELPSDVIEAFGFAPGHVIIARVEGERLIIYSHRENIRELQAMAPQRAPGLPLLSDELIAERRLAAATGE